jgi:hypothetical protein
MRSHRAFCSGVRFDCGVRSERNAPPSRVFLLAGDRWEYRRPKSATEVGFLGERAGMGASFRRDRNGIMVWVSPMELLQYVDGGDLGLPIEKSLQRLWKAIGK